jgi:hypothetical protein
MNGRLHRLDVDVGLVEAVEQDEAVGARRVERLAISPNAVKYGDTFTAIGILMIRFSSVTIPANCASTAAAGNRRVGPRAQPVEDIVAEAPGTITAAGGARSRGKGVRTANGWAVVIARPMPAGLAPNVRTNIAFAVWDGAAREVGARKMRTIWVPLSVRG